MVAGLALGIGLVFYLQVLPSWITIGQVFEDHPTGMNYTKKNNLVPLDLIVYQSVSADRH
jgi:hypothetical protein